MRGWGGGGQLHLLCSRNSYESQTVAPTAVVVFHMPDAVWRELGAFHTAQGSVSLEVHVFNWICVGGPRSFLEKHLKNCYQTSLEPKDEILCLAF